MTFRSWLALLLALGLGQQILILAQGAAENPFARTPMLDAQAYWEHAGRIAGGAWIAERPFLSAPLYTYILAGVHALGGGLGSVYALQLCLHLATAALLAISARCRFGSLAGLCAAGLWLALDDPAYYVGRVLGVTLQSFLVALLLAYATRPLTVTRARAALLGLLAGLNCLAHPPFLLGLPVLSAWVAWRAPARRRGLALAALVAAAALATIAPATLHNRRASGEWIAISAQAGLTFHHGNQPGARGIYAGAVGVSRDRARQNLDARLRARDATADESWSGASRYYFGQGLAWWRAEPRAAAVLGVRKLWWFLTGRFYGDIHVPVLEIQDGYATRLAFAPIPAAWWMLPTLVGLAVLLRREGRALVPAAALFAVPLVCVCVFWYSPRYRAPALPVAAWVGGWMIAALVHWRDAPRLARVCAISLVAAAGSARCNAAFDFDRPGHYRAQYELALAQLFMDEGKLDEAERHVRRAESLGNPSARGRLGEIYRLRGDRAGAIAHLRETARDRPDDVYVLRALAVALAETRQLEEAREVFERVLALDPNDWQSESGLGNVLLETGRSELALGRYERAIHLEPRFFEARYNLAIALGRIGRVRESVAALQGAIHLRPEHVGALAYLAWTLATCADETLRDGARATNLATRLNELTGYANPSHLDTLGAALAAADRMAEAIDHAGAAVRFYAAVGDDTHAAEVEGRLALYRQGRAFVAGE